MLGLCAGLVWALLFSTIFAVRTVRVSGERVLDEEVVRALAAVRPDTPLARVDTARVTARVRTLPQVQSAEVLRRWPSAVEIRLRERLPTAVVPAGVGYGLVDRSGVTFRSVEVVPAGLPVVRATGRAALRAALDALAALPVSLRQQVRQVSASTADSVVLTLAGRRTVVWGDARRNDRKAVVLRALLGRDAVAYDVSAPDAPTTRSSRQP